ncbi:MAG: xanthine dehydrogenase family protein subunit M [Candidatus Anstonellales archaeon]
MLLPKFEYFSPQTIEELADYLAKYKKDAKILSGGTDLLVAMKDKQIKPKYLIDINRISDLRKIIYEDGKGLIIGSATRLDEIEQNPIIREKYYALYQGASLIGSPQVRAMGSIGGNSCTASPAADTPPPLIIFGAKVNLLSKKGKRQLSLEDFILDNRITALEEDEFLESFILEEPWPNSSSFYLTMGLRNAMEIDIANLAVNLSLDPETRKVKNIRIAMGAVAPKPLRATQAENFLKNKEINELAIRQAADLCAEESKPIDDFRSSASYRREVIKVLARRAITAAMESILKRSK